jgi:hypothetical protein
MKEVKSRWTPRTPGKTGAGCGMRLETEIPPQSHPALDRLSKRRYGK